MNVKKIATGLVLLTLSSPIRMAGAACLDPKTLLSGYKVPLALEVRTTEAIVVGRVLSEQGLQEDPTDPDGYTAYDVTIKVLASLKGTLPSVIVIRNDNTSARYPMSVGEEHVMFVSRDGHTLWVNSCGNSAAMPEGKKMVTRIQTELRKLK